MADPPKIRWYPARSAPGAGDIVWCHFPTLEKPGQPGPKERPAIVRLVRQSPDGSRISLDVSYGTSKLSFRNKYSFVVMNLSDMFESGLPQATRFQLDRTITLPWAKEFFKVRPSYQTPYVGSLTKKSRGLLGSLVQILTANGDL